MAQTGCPKGTGTGGSSYPNLKAEFNAEPHVRGICSMARSQSPDSANSQFFIVFDDATFLDKQYTVWGKVIEGMENVDKIKRGEPVSNPDKMVSVKVGADAIVRQRAERGCMETATVMQLAAALLIYAGLAGPPAWRWQRPGRTATTSRR